MWRWLVSVLVGQTAVILAALFAFVWKIGFFDNPPLQAEVARKFNFFFP